MKKFIILLIALTTGISANAGEINPLKNLTIYAEEDFAPFNYYNDEGVLKGASVEITNKILKNANFKYTNIRTIPWARAYHLTQVEPNTVLFTMYRTPLRENLFTWVGPISKSEIVLLTKKGAKFDEDKFTVAAVRASASLQTAQENGVTDDRVTMLNETSLGLKMLEAGRVDTCAISMINAKNTIKMLNMDFKDFEVYRIMSERELYFGFNKNTDPRIINYFTKKLNKLKDSGFVEDVLNKYDATSEI